MTPTPTNKPIEPVKPLPCPFCGVTPDTEVFNDDPRVYGVYCINCKIGFSGVTEKEAMESWNRRTPLTQSHADLPRRKHALVDLNPLEESMKILTSGTTVSEGDKFTHVEWEVYEKVKKDLYKALDYQTEQTQNARNRYYEASDKIQSLESQIKELEDDVHQPELCNEKILLLQAQNEKLVEALSMIKSGVWSYDEIIQLAQNALTSPPSESIKEGEREPTAEECLEWLFNSGCDVYMRSGKYYVRHNNDGLYVKVTFGKTPLEAIQSAMKSEAERK